MPFTAFIDSYCDHMEENYHYFVSKSVEIFSSILQDEECCMSLVFDKFLGEMVYHRNAVELSSITANEISEYTIFRICAAKTINDRSFPDKNKEFLLNSTKKIKEITERLLLEGKVIVIYGDTITTCCNKEFTEKMVESSLKNFKLGTDESIIKICLARCGLPIN